MQLGVPFSELLPAVQPLSGPSSSLKALMLVVFIGRMPKRTMPPSGDPERNIINPMFTRGLVPSSELRMVVSARSSDWPCLRLESQCCAAEFQFALLSMMMRTFGLVAATAAALTKRSMSSAFTSFGGVRTSAAPRAAADNVRAVLWLFFRFASRYGQALAALSLLTRTPIPWVTVTVAFCAALTVFALISQTVCEQSESPVTAPLTPNCCC